MNNVNPTQRDSLFLLQIPYRIPCVFLCINRITFMQFKCISLYFRLHTLMFSFNSNVTLFFNFIFRLWNRKREYDNISLSIQYIFIISTARPFHKINHFVRTILLNLSYVYSNLTRYPYSSTSMICSPITIAKTAMLILSRFSSISQFGFRCGPSLYICFCLYNNIQSSKFSPLLLRSKWKNTILHLGNSFHALFLYIYDKQFKRVLPSLQLFGLCFILLILGTESL